MQLEFQSHLIVFRPMSLNWPSRSPDLTLVDYWFRETLKARVFHYQSTRSLEHLRHRIQEECSRVIVEELRNAIAYFRVDLMLQAGGRYFEDVL